MLTLFWVVLILFSIVKTKIVNYSSMTYFPLAYLATYSIFEYQEKKQIRLHKLFLGMGSLFAVIFMAFPILLNQKEWLYPLLKKDPFAVDSVKIMEMPSAMALIGVFMLVGLIYSYRLMVRKQIITGAFVFALINAAVFNLNLILIVPYVERAVQGPAIEFYSRFAGKDVYVETVGFKSYGKLFYAKKSPELSGLSADQMLDRKLTKDAYFISKTNKTARLDKMKNVQFLEKKGGYYLYYKPAGQ